MLEFTYLFFELELRLAERFVELRLDERCIELRLAERLSTFFPLTVASTRLGGKPGKLLKGCTASCSRGRGLEGRGWGGEECCSLEIQRSSLAGTGAGAALTGTCAKRRVSGAKAVDSCHSQDSHLFFSSSATFHSSTA